MYVDSILLLSKQRCPLSFPLYLKFLIYHPTTPEQDARGALRHFLCFILSIVLVIDPLLIIN